MKLAFNSTDFDRRVADSADLILKNRYFEENPSLNEDGSTLLSRPGMRRLTTVGEGPIRGMKSEPGSFTGDLFVASGEGLYRIDNTLDSTLVYSGLADPIRGSVSMAITAVIGEVPEFCFISDGSTLYVYTDNGFANGNLSGSPQVNDVVRIGDVYYKFTSGDVNLNNPQGTLASPYLVLLGGTDTLAFLHLYEAINDTGNKGVDYSANTIENPFVIAYTVSSSVVNVRARDTGAEGNTIVTTETGAALTWSAGTLVGGGGPSITQVTMPDDIGVIDVAVTNSYVLVLPRQEDGYQGRFYWIEPGETTVDPLNYATAERSPDGIYGLQVFGDQFWLPGESTTEVWYVTGDPQSPMARLQGIVLDRGSWSNTSCAVHENMIIVDADGGVFMTGGGAPQRVSTPSIEEQIRKAISAQQASLY